jgi:8-oxo-dGTP pyrophosphatase MutT (NUDIX family)
MTTAQDIEQLTQAYLKLFPEEAPNLASLTTHNTHHDEGIFSRKTSPGHLTAAGYVIARTTQRILLIEHTALHKFMQPGGHYEQEDENTLQAAKREVLEETGLSEDDLHYLPVDPKRMLVPFQIDVHDIPANPKKGEPAHQHYDFRYLFMVDDESEVQLDARESNAFRWTSLEDFAALEPTYACALQKMHRLKLLDR